MRNFSITSVSVTPGHPDKLCDRVSDAVVDAFLRVDRQALLEVECAVSAGIVFLACHSASSAEIDVAQTAREVVLATGYDPAELDGASVPVMTSLSRLPTPARRYGDDAVPTHNVTTFGYATATTPTLLPLPIHLAHRLARGLQAQGPTVVAGGLHPDGQVQVMVRFADRRPVAVEAVTFLVQPNAPDVSSSALQDALRERVLAPALARLDTTVAHTPAILVNPEGAFAAGGPARHAGVTGRKLGVDTYGDFAHQPSTALSGKDPGRIDRIATYAARYAARNVVAAGLAAECEVQLCYSVGRAEPASVDVETFGSGRLSEDAIGERLRRALDLRPAAIEQRFCLRRSAAAEDGFFQRLAAFGQVGRDDLELPWERDELVPALAG